MIYGGNLMSNFAGSVMSKDYSMTKDVILSKLHRLIKDDKSILIEALKKSGISVKDNVSDKELINKSVDALYDNKSFRIVFANLIAYESPEYSKASGNFDFSKIGDWISSADKAGVGSDSVNLGSDAVSKIGGGGATGGVVGAIAGAVDSIFGFASSKTQQKTQREADKNKLISQLLQEEEKKTNWLPVVIIGGVLLVGGLVAFATLRRK